MSFLFKKIFRSFSTSPNSKDQHSTERLHRRWDNPFPATNFGLTSFIGDTQHPPPANVLESFAVGAGNAHSGQTLTPRDGDRGSIGGAIESNEDLNGAQEEDAGVLTCGFGLYTESLGFESIDERLDCGDPTLVQSLWTVTSTSVPSSGSKVSEENQRSRKGSSKDFPPMLPSLEEYGRPRFNLVKVRSDGRLLIVRAKNVQPRLVRSRSQDGRLRIHVELPQEEEEEEEEEEGSGSLSQHEV